MSYILQLSIMWWNTVCIVHPPTGFVAEKCRGGRTADASSPRCRPTMPLRQYLYQWQCCLGNKTPSPHSSSNMKESTVLITYSSSLTWHPWVYEQHYHCTQSRWQQRWKLPPTLFPAKEGLEAAAKEPNNSSPPGLVGTLPLPSAVVDMSLQSPSSGFEMGMEVKIISENESQSEDNQ